MKRKKGRAVMPPQNIYDDPDFFSGYWQLRTQGTGLNDVLEQPSLLSLLPATLKGQRILDLGCGFGDFARKARAMGAQSVVGIDASEKMLNVARQRTDDSCIEYRRVCIEDIDFAASTFDAVVSSLALHYVEDYESVVSRVSRALVPGGLFVFSVEHPICTSMREQKWVRDTDGTALYWPLDKYRSEGPRHTTWFVDDVIKYHRTIETYINTLLQNGFVLRRILEPGPVTRMSDKIKELALHNRRPPFLLIAAEQSG